MEDNNFTTTNLGNLNMNTGIPNVAVNPVQIAEPVSVETPLAPVANEAINTLTATTEVNIVNPVQVAQPTETVQIARPTTTVQIAQPQEIKSNQPIETNTLTVTTTVLGSMLNNALKVVSYDQRVEITTIVQLIFSAKGLEVKVRNAEAAYLYQLNTERTYTTEDSICMNSKFISDLIAKINTKDVTFVRQPNNIVQLISGDNTYLIAEKTDTNTGESINLEAPIDFTGANIYKLNNVTKFRDAVVKCSNFSLRTEGNALFNGVYCSGDVIVSSNASSICVAENVPELKDISLFIPKILADCVIALSNAGEVELSYKITENRQYPSVLQLHSIDKDNNSELILMGTLQTDENYVNYPLNQIAQFRNLPLGDAIIINRNTFREAIERTKLFIKDSDQRLMTLATEGNILIANDLSKSANERIFINNAQNINMFARLDAEELILVVNCDNLEDVTLQRCTTQSSLLAFKNSDSLILVSEIEA